MINIMLTDDHLMVREGIKQLLELEDGFNVIRVAGDGEECIEKIKKTKDIDVLLLDINMPKKNGIETAQILKNYKKCPKIIMLTVHNEIDYLEKVIDIGVEGYVLKDADLSTLKKAIISVYNGESYIQPELIPILNSRLMKKDSDKELIELLTRRELEVLKLLAVGMFNKAIAEKLDISERTVKNHISSIFKKINVVDRTQAAVFAIRNNIIEI